MKLLNKKIKLKFKALEKTLNLSKNYFKVKNTKL